MRNTNKNSITSDSTWAILGALRFFLALIVLFCHLYSSNFREEFLGLYKLSGYVAVMCFLVVSGFSISASYDQNPKGFYRRRFIRVYPIYVLSILSCLFVHKWIVGDNYTFANVLQNLFFLNGITTNSIIANGPIWSLAIEVLFYLATPLLKRLSTSSIALIAASSLGLYLTYHGQKDIKNLLWGGGAALLFWAWLLGYLAHQIKNPVYRGGLIATVFFPVFIFKPMFLDEFWYVTVGVTVGAFMLVNMNLSAKIKNALSYLGDISYPLYIIHFPIFIGITIISVVRGIPAPWWYAMIASVLISVVVDMVYDKPAKKFLKKLLKV